MQRYYLRSFGCQMNEHDAERLRALLEGAGLVAVDEPHDADVLLYNTCTVRQSADERLAGHLGTAARLKREQPHRKVFVTGCLAQAEQERLFTHYPFVDGALGPQNVHRLPELLEEASRGSHCGFFDDGPAMSGDLPARRARRHQAWVQTMSGCTNFCTYCIVPYVRGPERSRPLASVVSEVRALVADGVVEVTLLGQNVNAYGLDLRRAGLQEAPDFAELLHALDAVEGLARIRFLTSHPKDLSPPLIEAIASLESVCEHVHLPVQAGSTRVLAAMGRGYTAEEYLELVAELRRCVPEVCITSDLIAGFPGETDEEFAETLALVEAAAFDRAFTFVYSPRSGTEAADFADHVPTEVKRERVERLIALTQRLALEANLRSVGRTTEILVEGSSRDGVGLRGRTRQNLTLNASGTAEPGAIVEVEVTGATSTSLRGRII